MFLADDGPARVSSARSAGTHTAGASLLLERSGHIRPYPVEAELGEVIYLGETGGAQCYGSPEVGVDWWRHEAVIDLTDSGLRYHLAELSPPALAAALSCGPLPRGRR
ncbi:MAG: hypothetical protein ACOYEV_06860 [Candidatus Nanopelagicales bacterium]